MNARRTRAKPHPSAASDLRADAIPDSMPALMTWALWLELDAIERYRELADVMETHNNREVGDLFRRMVAIESRHADAIMKSMGWKAPPARPSGPAPWRGLESPESIPHEDIHYLMQPYHALELALAGEERAVRFFAALADNATEPAVKAAAREMAEEEQEHVLLVRAWMEKVPKPDEHWRDDPDPPRYTD
ncbi:MAG: ferritin family protein [Burkholderiales bacterium]|nr:ferritin family protein [Burkholderiales bacterium]MCE7877495.1 rubrerythrin [Betaproteobacteria bacterium PRO3]